MRAGLTLSLLSVMPEEGKIILESSLCYLNWRDCQPCCYANKEVGPAEVK
jgi:hypothetical protein